MAVSCLHCWQFKTAKLSSVRDTEAFQPLLDAVSTGFGKRFHKFVTLDVSNKCKFAILVSSSNPRFKFNWIPLKINLLMLFHA